MLPSASGTRFRRFFHVRGAMSSSKKCRQLVAEPIKDKGVEELPGVGAVAAKRLKNYHYPKAEKVLGIFLMMERNEVRFCRWLMSEGCLNSRDQKICYNALNKYCNNHL